MNLHDAKEYLTYYFTGELERMIKKFKLKKNQKFEDEYYNTTGAHLLLPAQSSNKTGYSDPTAARAISLADFTLWAKKSYELHLKLKKVIDEQLQEYDQEEINLLKAELSIDYTQKEILENSGLNKYWARKRIDSNLKQLNKKISPIFVELNKI